MVSDTCPPLVSCIMPTANRRRFVPQSIIYFLRQDYPARELVIVDDGADSVADLVPDHPQVRYLRLTGQRTLGAKRNECVEASRGDFIMHWDDDDWMAPHRITYQVEAMLRAQAEVCGLREMLFHEPATGRTWLYRYPPQDRPWLAGGSLLYTRDFWRRAPFPAVPQGEDTRFVWSHSMERALALPDYSFYVAMIHPANTSPKHYSSAYWSSWGGEIRAIMGEDLDHYLPTGEKCVHHRATQLDLAARRIEMAIPEYCILMVVHNTCAIVKISTLRTLRHISGQSARLVVVDNRSTDGSERWLELLAQRGDIDLIRSPVNMEHGPALELARTRTASPFIVTLDSDAFPLANDWLQVLRERLVDPVKVVGIRHYRDYIHPSCLLIARQTLDEHGLTFLNEKDQPSQLDVAERVSVDLKARNYQIAGLELTTVRQRGSVTEPIYLGSNYQNLVYHHWYTTRTALARGLQVDDVPKGAVEASLAELLAETQAEPKDLTVVVTVRAGVTQPERQRNAKACLLALNLQDLPRWRYRIIVVEQDQTPHLESSLGVLADQYIFVVNPGPFNRAWGFNIGACQPGAQSGALCLIDADIVVPPDFLQRGLQELQAGAQAILPYSEMVYLDTTSTQRLIQDRQTQPLAVLNLKSYTGMIYTTSQGGCIFVTASLYHQIGGYDERFRGWGHEDREFWSRLSRTTTIQIWPNRLAHLDHPRPQMDDTWAQANRRLYLNIAQGQATGQEPIGNPNKYRAEKGRTVVVTPQPGVGMHEWENWHKWENWRIERIVADERQCPLQISVRWQLAELIVGLGDSLLDVGCGPGAMWTHLDAYRPRFTWCGVDATVKMMEAAQRFFPHVPVYHADSTNLPFQDDSFDIVLLRHVLEHLPQATMEQALKEAMRVARQAVVVSFYVPPISFGSPHTKRVGEGFLETRWTTQAVEAPIAAANWIVTERRTLVGRTNEWDIAWVIKPNSTFNNSVADSAKVCPLVSIIMPTYHRSHVIHRTIEAIQCQTYTNWELIIIDNAGTDNYHFDDPRIRVFIHADYASASYARNKGLEYATGDFVCFFDDDDDMFPHYLERYIAALQTHPEAKLACAGMIVTGGAINYSYATPECCLLRPYATPTWRSLGVAHDQLYFDTIIKTNLWSEEQGDIIRIREALCQANMNLRGGLRQGKY